MLKPKTSVSSLLPLSFIPDTQAIIKSYWLQNPALLGSSILLSQSESPVPYVVLLGPSSHQPLQSILNSSQSDPFTKMRQIMSFPAKILTEGNAQVLTMASQAIQSLVP